MGNRNGGRVIGRGLDGKAWLEGKLAGTHFRGLDGELLERGCVGNEVGGWRQKWELDGDWRGRREREGEMNVGRGVVGRGLDGKAWLEGKLAGTGFRGLEGKIVFWGTKMLAGSCCEGVFSGRGMAGETIFVWVLAGGCMKDFGREQH